MKYLIFRWKDGWQVLVHVFPKKRRTWIQYGSYKATEELKKIFSVKPEMNARVIKLYPEVSIDKMLEFFKNS